MKIISLEAENIKCLKAISIKPDGSLVVIGGDNAQGKSATLDCIQFALDGKDSIPDKPIRNGQEKAKILLDLGDIQVLRTFTNNGSRVVVKNKDGASFSSPQSMLNKLYSNLTFDPLEFSEMDSKKQVETLKQLVGLDFTKLDNEYKEIFDQRTEINRQGKSLKSQYDSIPNYENLPDKEISIAELSNKLSEAIENNQNIDKVKSELDMNLVRLASVDEEIKKLQKEKKELNANIKKLKDNAKNQNKIDISKLKNQIQDQEQINKKIREKQKKINLGKELEKLRNNSQELTNKLNKINENKLNSLSEIKLPVEDLSFNDDCVTYKNIPFNQCSTAEKIKISVLMGLAMNPKLKVLLIREGSLLDSKNLKMIAQIAERANAQIWVERVSKGKECSVIIEDGNICEN